MDCPGLHCLPLLAALAATSLLAHGAAGAPLQYAVVSLAEPPGGGRGGIRDASDGGAVMLVPLEAPPVPVLADEVAAEPVLADDEDEEEGDEDPWEALSSFLGGFGELGEAGGAGGEAEAAAAGTRTSSSSSSSSAAAAAATPMRFFSNVQSLADESPSEPAPGSVAVLRIGRGLKSLEDPFQEVRESRVLEEDGIAGDDMEANDDDDDVGGQSAALASALEPARALRRGRRQLRVVVRRARADDPDGPKARADEAAPSGGFMQGINGAVEESEMVVGTFQAMIMPGSAATGMGQQIQGFMSNMPQIPGGG